MIPTQLVRELSVRGAEGVVTHLSAASALVRAGSSLYVIADDQTHLARFAPTGDAPGEIIPLFDEQWPTKPKARKAAKADLESLLHFPPSVVFEHGALLALGSGSRPNRERGVLLTATSGGEWMPPRIVDLSALFAPLKPHFAQLNIEGALVVGNEFILLHRGNKGDARNACIRFASGEVENMLAHKAVDSLAFELCFYSLGEVAGVPLCFTDAAALPDARFAFSAVAENVADNYNDGQCAAAAVGVADLQGNVLRIEALDRPYKVEGIEVQLNERRIDLLLVTDADAPEVPARLLRAQITDY